MIFLSASENVASFATSSATFLQASAWDIPGIEAALVIHVFQEGIELLVGRSGMAGVGPLGDAAPLASGFSWVVAGPDLSRDL